MTKKLLALTLLFPTLALADVQVWTWEDCVKRVITNNADLKAAADTRQVSVHQEKASKSGFLPELNGNLGYNLGNNSTISNGNVFSNLNSAASSGMYLASLQASQNLFAGFQDVAKMQRAEANTRAADAVLRMSKARISYDLKVAFSGLMYAKELQTFTEEIIRRRGENMRLVELRFQSGRENKGSVLLSQAYVQQARYSDIQAKNAKRVALAQLARSLGVDEYSDFEVTGAIPANDPNPDLAQNLPQFRELALQTADYQQAIAQEEASYEGVTIAKSQFYPSLSLNGSLAKQGAEFFPNHTNRWSVGANLSFPFFAGGKDYYSLQASVTSWSSAEYQRENVSRQILAKLEQAYASYIEAVAKYKVDESFKQAVVVRSEIARQKYNNGLLTFEDWDIIENDLISRQQIFLQSKRDRIISEAAWEQAQSKGVIP